MFGKGLCLNMFKHVFSCVSCILTHSLRHSHTNVSAVLARLTVSQYRVVHMGHHVNAYNILDFGAFQISDPGTQTELA